jgi:hypothetical protein
MILLGSLNSQNMGLYNKKKVLVTEEEYNALSREQKGIYDSILSRFPSTCQGSAYNTALKGGISFQFEQN